MSPELRKDLIAVLKVGIAGVIVLVIIFAVKGGPWW